ncbi:hypothetical protein ACFRAU_16175 [Arthrobacter sp. NPDC056691]|uniref:hypothetical protein n=1 Tax=unclassified Arthrobacter TaxID=235627 RepID=UPI00366B3DDA
MPELNNDASYDALPGGAAPDSAAPDSAVDAALSDAAWPELTVPGSPASEAGVADPAVLAVLDRVREIPGLPVSEHPAAYAAMHDALLEALNEEPQHGPGAA